MKNINKKVFTVFIALILVVSLCLTYVWYCQNALEIETYNFSTDKITSSVKVALISDMHNKEFGENNIKLVEKIAENEPDLIAVCGDMISNNNTDHQVVITLLEQLTGIAPTYYSLGNHESRYVNLDQLITDIQNTGAVFLDNEMTFFSGPNMNGEEIVIGGLLDYPYYEKYAPDFENEEARFMDEFLLQHQDNYCILLSHIPENYIWKFNELELDLILSGHTHGGVIQLPFIGGLYAPTQKFFPEYDEGYFSSGTANMIITSGLGVSSRVPRINNNPEICIININ